jgi:hypothetical protein
MVDATDIVSGIAQSRSEALPSVVGNIDEDPDRAQRAYDLSKIIGSPATSIYNDLDEFERNTKAKMASDIVANNPHLSTFVQSDPMVPKIFANSYGVLDDVSSKVSAMSLPLRKGFTTGVGGGHLGDWTGVDWEDPQVQADRPIASTVAALTTGVTDPFEAAMRMMSGGVYGAAYGAAAAYKSIVGKDSPIDPDDLAQAVQDPATMATLGPLGEMASAALSHNAHLAKAMPWIEHDRLPPPTVLPELDKIRTDVNSKDIERLMDATKASGAVPERTTSPELYRQFIADHTDAEIGIGGDAVSALYGDKVPAPDDNLLGWVPGIEAKVAAARATGDDVNIPLADWLTHIPDYPDVMKALEDDIRVRPEGITANEAKLTAEAKVEAPEGATESVPLPDPVAAVRSASALEPMLSVGDRKLQLQKLAREPKPYDDANFMPHDFQLLDEKGNTVGALNLTEQRGGKDLYVDMVNGVNGLGPRDFGPRLMVDLLRQLKAEFPNAERLGGHRVSGAREAAGKEMTMPAAWIKLDVGKGLDATSHDTLRQIFDGGQWETFSPATQAYIKPDFARSESARALVQTVSDEAARIVPQKVTTKAVESIKVDPAGIEGQQAGDDVKASGIYMRFQHAYPIILAALDTGDTLGTFRHEAIHHLRQYGFFQPQEWEGLRKAALDGGWLDRYAIHKLYPTGSTELKLEEAIAERYKDWVRDQRTEGMTAETLGLFEQLKAFFNAIRERIGQMLGKDPTWEDIFKKVDTGEVGSRVDTLPLDPRAHHAFDDKLSVKSPDKDPLPPPKAGDIRYYHGTAYDDASGFAGKTFVTPHYTYARDYRGGPNNVLYTDMSKDQAIQRGLYDEVNDYPRHGPIDDGAAVLRPTVPTAKSQPPPGGSRPFERAQTLGMTDGAFRAYDKRLQERHQDDVAKATARAEAQKSRQLTAEWKSNRVDVRKEVSDGIRNRPDVATDLFLSGDGLYGRRRGQAYRLDADALTPKQKAMLPPEYYGKDGLNPDDVAGMFGYGSGDAMVDKLTNYNIARRTANMSSKDFVSRITDIETDRQMKLRYGNLDENVMDAVKEQVAGETQQNLVHEETLYYGQKIGQLPATRENILAAVKEEFGKSTVGSVSSDRLMRRVGQQGRAIEAAHLKEDWATAFKLAQQREYTLAVAQEAMKVERDQAKFEKTIRSFRKQWDPQKKMSIAADWQIFMRDILSRVEQPYGMSVQGLAKAIGESGYKGLQDFVETKEKDNAIQGLNIPVADYLLEPNFHKPFNDLTVDEFRGLKQSIDVLKHLGREEQRIEVAGEKQDRADWLAKARTQLTLKFPSVKVITKPGAVRTYLAALTNLETLFGRFDGRDPRGLFTKFFIYPGMEAGSYKVRLEKDFASVASDLGKIKDPGKALDSPFVDPHNGQKIPFTRKNLEAVIANLGNAYNERILTKGWKIEPAVLWSWLEKVTTPADWDRAQARGDMFSKAKGMSDTVYQQMYGVAPEDIQVRPFTMHGKTYPGYYHPIDYDPLRSRLSKMQSNDPSTAMFASFWPSPSNAYTKRRMGNVDVINLDPDMIPIKLNQILHDVAFRQFVANTAKITRDNGFRRDVSYHYGPEYVETIDKWLERIAGNASFNSNAMALASRWSNAFRQNVVSTYIAFGLTTIEKHGPTAAIMSAKEVGSMSKFARVTAEVGASHFSNAVMDLFGRDPDLGDSLWKNAVDSSEELQQRDRNFLNTVMGQHDILTGKSTVRNKVAEIGSKGVAFSDMISAVPLWVAKYREAMEENPDAGEATYLANRAVRRAHGSTNVVNQPQIVSTNGVLAPWLTSIYGFFGTNMQRRIEIAHDINDAYKLGRQGDISAAAKLAPQVMSSLFTYVIWPGLVEEAVTGQFTDDKRGWGTHALSFALGTAASTFIGLRDMIYGLTHGRDPQVGLLGSPLDDIKRLVGDATKHRPVDKANAGKLVQDAVTVFGDATGMGPKHIGTALRYGMDVYNDVQRPKTFGDVFRGVVSGTQHKRVER